MSVRKEQLGENIVVFCGDNREILPTLGRFDACVTDPPYGINESAAKNRTRGTLAKAGDYGSDAWDAEPADPVVIDWILQHCRWQVIFGGNYFTLPATSCWLVWDKVNGDNDFADCELAWTNLPKAVRRIHWMWNGMLRKGKEPRFHLTQKPLGVMSWCLDQLPAGVQTVVDPYCGSGTTGVACVGKEIGFTGIEREVHHFDTTCRRIAEELRRPRLFAEPVAKPVQEAMSL
jgi:site-specific DNA-methyltransferase (adenine-specific)/modification methylase